MYTINPKHYIERNAPIAVRNCIARYLWNGKSFRQSIQDEENYLHEEMLCSASEFISAMRDILFGLTTADGVRKYIKALIKSHFEINYRTVKQFIEHEFETDGLTCDEIAAIVRSEIEV